jgi:hypothetical protein
MGKKPLFFIFCPQNWHTAGAVVSIHGGASSSSSSRCWSSSSRAPRLRAVGDPVWGVRRVYGAFPAHARRSSLSLLWQQLRWVGQPHATKNRHNRDARRARSVEASARALGFEPRAPSGPAPEDCRLLGPLCSAYCNNRL